MTRKQHSLSFSKVVKGSCAVAILSVFVYYNFTHTSFNSEESRFGIILDAGSTGSRAHTIEVQHNAASVACPFHLIREDVFKVEPGISSYSKNVTEATKSIQQLIDLASNSIPKTKWPSTFIILRATAGLRLLPIDEADSLMSSIRDLFQNTVFYLPGGRHNSVAIMDGADEGLFAWITLNFLKGSLFNQCVPSHTASLSLPAIFDFGGASTQLTLLPSKLQSIESLQTVNYLHTLPEEYSNRFSIPQKLFSFSYLGLGLLTARSAMLLATDASNRFHISTENYLQSPCFPDNVFLTWSDFDDAWKITSDDSMQMLESVEKANFTKCMYSAESILDNNYHTKPGVVHFPENLKHTEIYAISFLFQRANEAGLINSSTGAVLTIQDLIDCAKKFCDKPDINHPFMCMDLTYMSALLHKGFDLPPTKKLHIYKKIGGVEISWPIGLFFDLLIKGF